ncbi:MULTISPECIES: hypothetical protein [Hyphomicrobiales]|uniref:hypothetical protein n=2 Tax=Hyphomicrobiales TaxID=356 RepID=UPI000F68EB21|nr:MULTISPECIES: hypothetical protein [Hyphomicrobiales]MDH1270326.1 hypothetical protein [Agrobacterium pusense]MDX4076500.1 hypothetical protein [Brucella sp. NBRC 113783]
MSLETVSRNCFSKLLAHCSRSYGSDGRIEKRMKAFRKWTGAMLFLLTIHGAVHAQETRSGSDLVAPPPPVVLKPGGDGNVSQYEYAPEQQPTWQYAAPGSAEDACSAENALLRDQVRDLQSQTMQLQAEIANLKARNQALQKAASANQ